MGSMSKGMEDRSAAMVEHILRGLHAAGHKDVKVGVFDAGHRIAAVENRNVIGLWVWEYSTTDPMPKVEE